MTVLYPPWAQVYDLDIPVDRRFGVSHVRIKWAAASTPERVVRTATFMAALALQAIQFPSRRQEVVPVLTPPLTRLSCSACGNDWDCWVNEDGTPEDARNVYCATSNCARVGKPGHVS